MIVLDAPTNLGLRPPAPGVEPGVKRLAEVLRGCGIVERLGAGDAGRVVPPAYVRDDIQACRALVGGYTRELAERLGELLDAGERPLVLGGDCSILLGSGMAMHPVELILYFSVALIHWVVPSHPSARRDCIEALFGLQHGPGGLEQRVGAGGEGAAHLGGHGKIGALVVDHAQLAAR